MKLCLNCQQPIEPNRRKDTKFCLRGSCRQRYHDKKQNGRLTQELNSLIPESQPYNESDMPEASVWERIKSVIRK